MKILHLHHILLPVSDPETAARFYEAIGMERLAPLNPRMRWMGFGNHLNQHQLHLWPSDELHPYNGWDHEPSPHFALVCDDLNEMERRIIQGGGRVIQAIGTRPNGTRYLFGLDLDGNRFEVMQLDN